MPPSSSKERGGISADGLGELMNLCLVVGPKTAASIRHAYLRNNETFLLYSMLLPMPNLDDEGEDDEEAYTKLKVKGMQNILRWMDVNQDWKSHCSDPEKFRQYQEEAGHRLMFQRDDAKEAFEFELVGGRFLRLKSIGEPLIGENHTEDQRRRVNELVNYYLVRVGNSCGTHKFLAHGETFEDILEDLRVDRDETEGDDDGSGDAIKMQLLKHPYAIFSNPAIATELGLIDVVRFLIEEKGLSVNGTWDGLAIWNQPNTLPITSLLFCHNTSIFKYILTVPNVDLGMQIERCPGLPLLDGSRLIHWFLRSHRYNAELLKTLLSHETVDVNACIPARGMTALHLACSVPGVFQSEDVEKIRILLENGADPLLRSSEESGSLAPLETLFFVSTDDRNGHWDDIFDLLMEASGVKTTDDLVEMYPFVSELEG
jgi:hypothetical protein